MNVFRKIFLAVLMLWVVPMSAYAASEIAVHDGDTQDTESTAMAYVASTTSYDYQLAALEGTERFCQMPGHNCNHHAEDKCHFCVDCSISVALISSFVALSWSRNGPELIPFNAYFLPSVFPENPERPPKSFPV